MRREADIPPLSVATVRTCSLCCDELNNVPAIKCVECEKTEVIICLSCFKLGAQAGEHLRGHNYSILDPVGPKVFDEEENGEQDNEEWGCYEDLSLLSSFIKSHLDQWPDISRDFGKQRSVDEALQRIDKYFLRSPIGDYVLGELRKQPLRLATDEGELSELPATHRTGDQQHSSMENGDINSHPLRPLSLKLHDGRWKGKISPPHSPISDKRLPLLYQKASRLDPNEPSTSKAAAQTNGVMFDFEDNYDDSDSTRSSFDCSPSISPRKIARVSLSKSPLTTGSPTSHSRRKVSSMKEEQNGMEVSSNRNSTEVKIEDREFNEVNGVADRSNGQCQLNGGKGKRRRNVGGQPLINEEKLLELREKFPNSYFYNYKSDSTAGKNGGGFDEEDLQLLAYMPKRDEFEHEYKNDAEQLISSIVSIRETDEMNDCVDEVDRFLNEVKLARIRRYNRVLKIRDTKRNIIREHRLVGEYLSIVKNNLSEKGRYNVLSDDVKHFNSKQKEEFFKPLLFRLRQVADKKTIDQLVESVGKMETLRDQIDELSQLQKDGIQELRGKLKVDALPGSWSRKRRLRKVDNIEQRKAVLRWKRIKRWSKKQGVATEETDE